MRCVTFIACALVIAACSDDKPKPPPRPAPVDGIELVKDGAEPRRPLRYHLAPTKTRLALAMDVDLETVDAKVTMPTLALAVTVGVSDVDASGTGKVKLSVVGAEAHARNADQAAAVRAMDRQARLLAGLVVSSRVAANGAVTGTKVDAVGRDLSQPM